MAGENSYPQSKYKKSKVRNDKILFSPYDGQQLKQGPLSLWTQASIGIGGKATAPEKGVGNYPERINSQTVCSGAPYLGIYQIHCPKCCKCLKSMYKLHSLQFYFLI